MKSSEALRLSRRLIESGKRRYLCIALGVVGGHGTLVAARINKVCKGESVIVWLHRHHFDVWRLEFATDAMAKKYRLAWIDWMIPQYEAIGD